MSELKIGSEQFIIMSFIERCSNKMMLRELVMNAIEASENSKRKQVILRVDKSTGIEKLAIWNTGRGMSPDELRKACDISSSLGKDQSLDGNFGMGAKVASLKANQAGMRYRSNKDGIVSEVVLGAEEDLRGRRVYKRFDYPEETYTKYEDVMNITSVMEDEGVDLSEDWTEVVLYGNDEKQNTVTKPFLDVKVPLRWIANTLYERFFRLPSNVKITLEEGTNSKGGERELKTFHDRIIKLSKEYAGKVRYETVETKNDLKIYYYYDAEDPKGGGHRYSGKGNVATDSSFCSVIYKNEFYDFRKNKSWAATAPKLSIPFGSRNISVAVELPDDAKVIPEGYRERILWNDSQKVPVVIEDFYQEIHQSMPEWVKDIIASSMPKKTTSDDIRDQLKNLLKELQVINKTLASVSGDGKPSRPEGMNIPDHIRTGPKRDSSKNPKTSRPPLTLKGGNSKSNENLGVDIPNFIVIRTQDELDQHPKLQQRGAMYVDESNNLFINRLYKSNMALESCLKKEFASIVQDDELLSECADNVIDNHLSLKVGTAVVFALAKKNDSSWDYEDRKRTWSVEALSLVCDFWLESYDDIKKRMNTEVKTQNASSEIA